MLIGTLSALLAAIVTGAAGPAPISQQRETLQCAVALRTAAETMRTSQGDSADARSLTLSASAAEERYRRQAATDGLNPLQIEIALAAERDARGPSSAETLRSCLGPQTAAFAR